MFEGDDGDGMSPYFSEISWIARSMSSRSDGVGVDARSEGVLDAVISPLRGFRFFFLGFDFFVRVDCDDIGFATTEADFSRTLTVSSSSSDWSTSFNCN